MLPLVLFARRNGQRTSHINSRCNRGSIAIIAALSFIPMTLIFAVVIDAGRSWVVRERLQNGVEAGAVAAAQRWMTTGSSCRSDALDLVAANGAVPINMTCSSTGTNRRGLVRVSADEDIEPIFSGLLGRSSVVLSASTGVRIGTSSSVIGLRPISLCADNQAVRNWIDSGMPAGVTVKILFQSPGVLCGGNVSGNWTVLDFNAGSSSNSETQDWVTNGYGERVSVGDIVYGTPGAPSSSIRFNETIGTSIVFPMFVNPLGVGSNARYTIAGFARAKVLAVQVTGASAQRGFTLQFEKGSLSGSTSDGLTDFGLTSWSVCSFDSTGDCS